MWRISDFKRQKSCYFLSRRCELSALDLPASNPQVRCVMQVWMPISPSLRPLRVLLAVALLVWGQAIAMSGSASAAAPGGDMPCHAMASETADGAATAGDMTGDLDCCDPAEGTMHGQTPCGSDDCDGTCRSMCAPTPVSAILASATMLDRTDTPVFSPPLSAILLTSLPDSQNPPPRS